MTFNKCITISCSEGEHSETLRLTKRAKYVNNGIFAPIPLSALHLTVNDFLKIYNSKTKKYDIELTKLLIEEINKLYPRNDFNVIEIS